MSRAAIGTLLLLAIALLGIVASACVLQRRVLYPRPPAGPLPPLPAGASRVGLGPDGGREAFFLRPHDAQRPFPVVLFGHGNGELIDHWVAPFGELARTGVGVLLVEYPGYGRSAGSPSERSITEAFVSAYDYLAGRPEVDAQRIAAYGRSLGGGAVCSLALRRPLAGLILESTFTSVRDLAARLGMPGALVLDRFDNLAALAELELPVLVIHGERDSLIPVAHGEALARATGSALVRLPCGHNDCPRPWTPVLAFLRANDIARGDRGRRPVPGR